LKEDQHIPYESLGRYVAGKIDADERDSVDRHLVDCAFCRQDVVDARAWQAELDGRKKKGWRRFVPWL